MEKCNLHFMLGTFFCLGENCVFEIFMMSSHMLRSVRLILIKFYFGSPRSNLFKLV